MRDRDIAPAAVLERGGRMSQGDYSYSSIYKGMPFGQQTDKSFSLT
ncbi:MAG: hypothetical protein OXN44_10345 [Acidimicrobiaceae bacterium]|nr:hypothetical protein [Acidimicrobiaceae bacterium]